MEGKLKVSKKDKSYEMDVQKNKGEWYTPCVYLWRDHDSVEIIT